MAERPKPQNPVPTPGQLARFGDPKKRVRPVDYTAVPKPSAPNPSDPQPSARETDTSNYGTVATPSPRPSALQQPSAPNPGAQAEKSDSRASSARCSQLPKPGPRTSQSGPQTSEPGSQAPKPDPQTPIPGPQTPKPGPQIPKPGPQIPKPGPRPAPRSAKKPAEKPAERFELVPPPTPAPADAVVTINPDDPRPYTRPLRINDEEVRTVSGASLAHITHDAIVLTIAEPDEVWTADAGTSDHYCRGPWTVQVRRADNHVIGAFPSRYALAVRPDDADPVDPAELAGKSNRKKRGTRHPGDVRALKKRLEDHGFVVSSSGATHGKVTHPDFPGLFTPWASTPSDRRHPQMVTAQVKRVFGIDIRG